MNGCNRTNLRHTARARARRNTLEIFDGLLHTLFPSSSLGSFVRSFRLFVHFHLPPPCSRITGRRGAIRALRCERGALGALGAMEEAGM
jgi:hypothetical protein